MVIANHFRDAFFHIDLFEAVLLRFNETASAVLQPDVQFHYAMW